MDKKIRVKVSAWVTRSMKEKRTGEINDKQNEGKKGWGTLAFYAMERFMVKRSPLLAT